MALSAATLKTGLEALVLTDNPADAANVIATAFDDYFAGAAAGPIPVTSGSTSGAKTALLESLTILDDLGEVLVGLDTSGAAAGLISTGIAAYWTAVGLAAATIFIAVPPAISGTPPPGLSSLTVAIEAAFLASTSDSLSLSDSAQALADAIHGTQSGGTIIFPPPAPPPPGLGVQIIS